MILSPFADTVEHGRILKDDATMYGLLIREEIESGTQGIQSRISLLNFSGSAVHVKDIGWSAGDEFECLFKASDARSICVYLDGWTMATPAGSRRWGEKDFRFNPDYLQFAVCEPADVTDEVNSFRAENMCALNDSATGKTVLFGFVTSADQFGRFRIALDEKGVKTFEALSSCDGVELPDKDAITSETIYVDSGSDAEVLFKRYASVWGGKMNARKRFPASPAGWCSWYYYFGNVTENDILENAEYLASHKSEYPCAEYVQLDSGFDTAAGDWFSCNEKFPHGLEYLAGEIKKKGLKPGIWFAPFMVEKKSVLAKEHPEWLIHDREGNVMFLFPWHGSVAGSLDGTHPEVQEHLRTMFAKVRAMGYEYIKLDFMMIASSMHGGVLHDPKATRAQALRRGLEAIRAGFGDDGFILGCTTPFGPQVGIVDGERVSTDIVTEWDPEKKGYDEAPTVPNVCRNVINHNYMHGRLWFNDPDTLIVRSGDNMELSEAETDLWAAAVRLTGGLLLSGDRLSALTPERSQIVKSIFEEHDKYHAYALDIWKKPCPEEWGAVDASTGRCVLGLFNFSETEKILRGHRLAPHTAKIIDR